ncbi:beta-glucosidase [Marinitoga hydrogenitolerans DSM 16785]|uniref:Beta-glucosidase n=1 Tax=Marinitoga hydrogenitolerans (strain DSM 16785 / JCM 12826 / AT1271) TaxID=1122195 RepID=A0A1M4XMZ9_MARH1|nr:family 1 glycosylhydrolase [Marinitoga hydrogenitolerans]SHE94855.1 beta-glucosidase [Marinitoga hydrogenitolerans DSM 16785]
MEKNISFPKGFMWGNTFSSYQIEKVNNKTNWDLWQEKGHIKDGSNLSILNNININLFNEILKISKDLHLNSLSFSLEWAKIIPEMNFINYKKLESYKNFILNLKKSNIEPIVILNYYTLPIWFEERGGFNREENLKFFTDYVDIILNYIGNIVDYYITFFEPGKFIKNSIENIYPSKNIEKKDYIIKKLYDLHKETYVMIKKKNKFSKISLAKNIAYDEIDFRKYNLLKYMDFISISYDGDYNFDSSKPLQKDDIGKSINPDVLLDSLLKLKHFDKPILILSTGIADENDIYRSTFLIKTLTNLHKALEKKIKILGFHHKTIFDLFEWEYGFSAKYGLYEFDYENIKFHIRSSGKIYANIVQNNGILSYLEKYTQ